MTHRWIIVGAGLAAARAVKAARAAGFAGEILLVGEEPRLPYERPPLSKGWLTDPALPEEPAIATEARWDEWRVDRALGVRAEALDPTARLLSLADGRRLRYDHLLVATGARPRTLAVPGATLDGVVTLRTLPDATELRARLREAGPVVIVGAGLVGLEVAAAARALGREVTVVEADAVPLRRLVGARMGAAVTALHEAHGVRFRLGATVAAVAGHRRAEAVVLASGERLPAALVVVGIGVAPDVAWLRGTGLDTAAGVPVDARGRTVHPGVSAAGDVACTRDPVTGRPSRVESYANAAAQGAAVGRDVAGEPVAYVPTHGVGSTQHGKRLQVVGAVAGDEEIVVRPHGVGRLLAFYLREGRVTAAFALDRARDVPAARALVTAGARVPPAVLADPEAPLGPWATSGVMNPGEPRPQG